MGRGRKKERNGGRRKGGRELGGVLNSWPTTLSKNHDFYFKHYFLQLLDRCPYTESAGSTPIGF